MRNLLGLCIALLAASVTATQGVAQPGVAQPVEQGPAESRSPCQAVAGRFLDQARGAAGGAVPGEGLRDAVVGDAVLVHDAATLEPIYELVSIRSGAGRMTGVVAVDPRTNARLWCRFGCRGDSLLLVSERDARRRLTGGSDTLGRHHRAWGGAGDAPSSGILVEGRDKHIYWRFSSGADSWLVDAIDAGAAVLASEDGTDARALRAASAEPPAASAGLGSCRPGEGPAEAAGDHIDGQEAPLALTLPASYLLPAMPYHFQITDWYCGPAALQTVMDWYGQEVPQRDIAHVANDRAINQGVEQTDLRRAAHFSGMSIAIQDSSLQGYGERKLGYSAVDATFYNNRAQRLKTVISAGYPVIALTWWDIEHHAWHYRVVKGYDDSLNVFICHDPWYWGGWWGPDVLIDQTIFTDNFWQYRLGWGMMATPWEAVPTISPSASVAAGDTISVSLKVRYPGPGRFDNLCPCSDCEALISLPAGLALAGGSPNFALPDLASGDSAVAQWDVVAVGPAGKWGIAFEARGLVSDSSRSYPSYTDSIGGYAYEEVWIETGPVAGWESEELVTPGAGTDETCLPGSRAMAVGDDGDVNVVWSRLLDFGSDVYHRKRTGSLWGAETRLTDAPGTSNNVCIAEGSDGRLHVAWSDARDGNFEIYYKTWDALGGWSADERVTYYEEVDCYPAIAADDSVAYLAWERHTGDSYRVAYVVAAARTDAGWSPVADVDASATRDSYRPSIACGPDGVVHIVYERQTADIADERECIAHARWTGAGWSTATEISSGIAFSRTPSVAVGADSRVHVAWQDGENAGGDIFYRCLDGDVWEPVEEIVTGGAEACTPSIAADALGTVHVAWVDNRHGAPEIYVTSKGGAGWGDAVRLSAAPGASLAPTIAAGPDDRVCALWTDARSGSGEIYFRERTPYAGVTDSTGRPGNRGVSLLAVRPQPFSDETQVTFTLAVASEVEVAVFDVRGGLIRLLASGAYGAGTHSAVWDGTCASGERVAPGVYFIRCNGTRGGAAQPVVLVR